MNKVVLKLFGLLVVFLILLPFRTIAWDGAVSGAITNIDVTGHNNYDFRITLEGSPQLCGNDNRWAYINQSDSNYQTFSSVLLAAKLTGELVTIYANQEKISGQSYCHIGYISIR